MSIASILIGYLALKSQQRHHRLSVKPIAHIHFITAKNRVEIEIRNDGVGPMICSNVRVYQDRSNPETNFRDAIQILQDSQYYVEWYGAKSEFAIRPGDQKSILRVYSDKVDPEYLKYRHEVLEEIQKFTLELDYRDIYDRYLGTLSRDSWSR